MRLIPSRRSFALSFAAAMLGVVSSLDAHPYASGLTHSGGNIQFILNEGADSVQVAFDNGTVTNNLGALAKGPQSFPLAGHTNYAIIVSKNGSGVPALISDDASNTVQFPSPRGIAVNTNPRARYFGRVYASNSTPGNSGAATKGRGIYVLNADTSDALGQGTNALVGGFANDASSPYHIGIGPDDSVYIGDFSASAATVWLCVPDLAPPAVQVLNGLGDAAITNGNHGRISGTPAVTGSFATGDLVLYTADGNFGPLSNSIQKYIIGSGPLPYTGAPLQLGCIGLCQAGAGTANLGTDLARGADGKLFGLLYRLNYGAPNLSVFAPDGLTVLWDSLAAAGGTVGQGPDLLQDSRAVSVSPDGRYVAVLHSNNSIDVMQLTNGVPDGSTRFTIANTPSVTIGRSIAWDAADNIYALSSGQLLLRVYSLGLTSTAITRNDATITNGSFQITFGTSVIPGITSQPQSVTTLINNAASFAVTAVGTPPLSYQWQFNGVNLSDGPRVNGAQSATLNRSGLQFGDAGGYRVIVSNDSGSVTSSVATLTVTADVAPVWRQFPNSPGPGNVRHDDIYFTDPLNGWASQNNNIYRTTNGGATWATNLTLAGTHFRSVCFATPMVGFAGNLGPGSYDGGVSNTNVLYRSFDGGVTWSNVPGFAEAGMRGLCAMYVLDAQHVYGAGRVRGPAFFIKSTDGGTNWSMVNLTAAGVMNGIMDVYFKDPLNGWVVGMSTNNFSSPPYYGRMARTTDGGNTWTPVVTTTISNCYFWKMSWPSANVGYCALQQNAAYTNVVFYKTTDGGNTWVSNAIPLASVGLSGQSFYLQGLGFVSENEGWIGGASGITITRTFLHTTNGGVSWEPAGYTDTQFINRIRFLSPTLGFAAGGNLHIFSVPLLITNQPQSQVVRGGTNVTLSVGAAGTGPFGYQWYKNGASAPGATASSLTLPNVARFDEGAYSVLVTNRLSGEQSSNAVVRVLVAERLAPPQILPGGQLQLLFNDADGGALLTTNDIATFEVQASTNLVDWTVLTNALTLTNGSMIFQDATTNYPARFYRILEH